MQQCDVFFWKTAYIRNWNNFGTAFEGDLLISYLKGIKANFFNLTNSMSFEARRRRSAENTPLMEAKNFSYSSI